MGFWLGNFMGLRDSGGLTLIKLNCYTINGDIRA